MSQKTKGVNAERELIHLFWSTNKWAACRVAGSGSMHYPSADILASNGSRTLAIECKSSKDKYQYLDKQEIIDLNKFAEFFKAEALIAVRFARESWIFLKPIDLEETEKNHVISLEKAKIRGFNFEKLVFNYQ